MGGKVGVGDHLRKSAVSYVFWKTRLRLSERAQLCSLISGVCARLSFALARGSPCERFKAGFESASHVGRY